jgi:L-amino acid N-acyltransferase YncA
MQTIRPATNADIEAIAAIYEYHVLHGTASFETVPPGRIEMMRRYNALREQAYPYLVAEADGVVVGYAYAGPYRARVAYRNTVEDSIYLQADQIGRGTGTLLLGALIAACEQRGYRQMIAVVGDSGSVGSIRLHERHGFSRIGALRSVGYKHGRWLDSVLLQRELGCGDSTSPAFDQ